MEANLMKQIEKKATAAIRLAKGSTIAANGTGIAVFGPGARFGMPVAIRGAATIGPYPENQTINITATDAVITYEVYPSSATDLTVVYETLMKIRRGYQDSRNNNVHVNGYMAVPPVITVTSSVPAPNTQRFNAVAQGLVSGVLASGVEMNKFNYCGGVPYIRSGAGNSVALAAATVASSGNLTATKSQYSSYVKVNVDAIDPVFQFQQGGAPVSMFVREDQKMRRASTAPTTLTLTGALVAATSGTLDAAWSSGPTGLYTATFSTGATRLVTLTSGATTITWTGQMAVTGTAAITAVQLIAVSLALAGTGNFIQATFPVRGKYEIWMEFSLDDAFIGVRLRPGETLEPAQKGMSLCALGDSLTTGTGAILSMNGYIHVMGEALGFDNIVMSGVGGQGYTTTVNGMRLINRLPMDCVDADGQPYDAYVFSMATNDRGSDQNIVMEDMRQCLDSVRRIAPNAVFIVLGCPANSTGPTTAAGGAVVCDAALMSVAASYNSTMVIGVPQAFSIIESILYGTGRTGAPTGLGNTDIFVGGPAGTDSTHWTDAGHIYVGLTCADRAANGIKGA